MKTNQNRHAVAAAKSKGRSSQTAKNPISPLVHQYLQASLSENTRRAYSNDLDHFLKWGGRIPASPECIASYLAEHAAQLSYATLSRRIVAIGRAHTVKKFQSPVSSEMVKATLHGIRRTTGHVKRKVSPALLPQVQAMVKKGRGLKGARDKALLLIGFAGAFRRSELVSIKVEDVQFVAEGVIIHLRRSKTDQVGKGRDIAIPYVRGTSCPVKALKVWLDQSGVTNGFLFRGVNRHGGVVEGGLTPQSVALILKERATAIGLDASTYSGHSLRAGLVTSAAKSGVSNWKICQQTGHRSEEVMQGYIRNAQLFSNNPLSAIW
jgi:site-specific recombinase XerD